MFTKEQSNQNRFNINFVNYIHLHDDSFDLPARTHSGELQTSAKTKTKFYQLTVSKNEFACDKGTICNKIGNTEE